MGVGCQVWRWAKESGCIAAFCFMLLSQDVRDSKNRFQYTRQSPTYHPILYVTCVDWDGNGGGSMGEVGWQWGGPGPL